MKKLFLSICLIINVLQGSSQELNCNIQLNSDRIQGSNKSVFNTLQKSISEFINNRKWTDGTYANSEKIDCSMIIIVNSVENDMYTCEIQIQSRRPVYNTSYNTPLFNYRDTRFNFEYKEFDQLELNENTLNSNLTAVLAYYAYIIIGFDLDSFSRLGGSPYFQAAENIVNSAVGSNYAGWADPKSSRTRYTLVNNLMDDTFKKFRNYFYEYHRLGLDEMASNLVNARARIYEGLPILREANRARPSAVLISTFLDSKTDELINIFKKASSAEKTEAVKILTDVNPTLTNRFEEITK
jgi:hypothetical protein